MDRPSAHAILSRYRDALYRRAEDPDAVRTALDGTFDPGAVIHLCHPLGDAEGGAGLLEAALAPLARAMPDLERTDAIAVAGPVRDEWWVGHFGHYRGTFERSFLDIPPTGRAAHMRYHEFFRVSDGRVVEMQAIWDIPALMMQAKAWPMGPSLGVEWLAPAPATGDGLAPAGGDAESSLQHVLDMLAGLQRHAEEGAEAMGLQRFWHPKMLWYGPAGIGTNRGIAGFRRDHQIPFLNAMPDRYGAGETKVFFAEGDYVGTTGWPNMGMTVSGGGWLGIAPPNRQIEMRSLDFWRLEDGLLRENWVLVDLLHAWDQLDVDVLARMREMTFNRQKAD